MMGEFVHQNGPVEATPDGRRVNAGSPRLRVRDSLLFKHILFVMLVIVLTAGTLGHLAYIFGRDMLREEVHERLKLVAMARTNLLETYTSAQLQHAALVANRTRLQQLLEERANGAIQEAPFLSETRQILNDSKQSAPEFRDLWITDLSGATIAATSQRLMADLLPGTAFFLKAANDRISGCCAARTPNTSLTLRRPSGHSPTRPPAC